MKWQDYLYYDETSPSCMRWNVSRGRRKKGDSAGTLGESGYWRVKLKGKMYRLHRLLTNAPPDKEVDHINGDRADNRLSNLRLVTSTLNKRNKALHGNNTSGICGVSVHNDGKGNTRAVAKWYENGKQVTKSFSFNVYGADEAVALASAARKEGINAQQGYTERHGS